MQSLWLNRWLLTAVMIALLSLIPNPRMLPQMVMKKNLKQIRHTMVAVHSHDSEGPMGWIGKGINSLLKAHTGVLSKEDGLVK